MTNWQNYELIAIATSAEEIGEIEAHLASPRSELVATVMREGNIPRDEAEELLAYEPVETSACHTCEEVTRKFISCFRKEDGVEIRHLLKVGKEFPKALFMLEYYDPERSYSGKMVIRAGRVVQEAFDCKQQSPGTEWVLPDIFVPFRAEWREGLEFGSLWDEWVQDMGLAVEKLKVPPTGIKEEL